MGSPKKTLTLTLKLLLPLLLAFSFLAAVYVRFYSGWITISDLPNWPAYLAYLAASVVIWSVLETRLAVASTVVEELSLRCWLGRLVRLDLLTLGIVSVGAFFWRGYSFSRYTVASFWLIHLLLAFGLAAALRTWWFRRFGCQELEAWLATDEISDSQLRIYAQRAFQQIRVRRFPSAAELMTGLRGQLDSSRTREILVALGSRQLSLFPEVLQLLEGLPVRTGILLPAKRLEAVERKGSLLVVPAGRQATESFDYAVSKRVLDFVLAAVGLLLLAPAMLLIALVILVTAGRPVLFSQQRVARGGARFRLYKFRTLGKDALERSEREWSVPPPTRAAAFLRATGLDELPQLLNVLRGDMSLVGPRPERPHFVELFQNELPFYSTRHRLQVGITGWAQVHGLRGDTSIAQRVECDLYYLKHWSLGLDLKILALTLAGFTKSVWAFGRTSLGSRPAGTV